MDTISDGDTIEINSEDVGWSLSKAAFDVIDTRSGGLQNFHSMCFRILECVGYI
jgi:hypothetical protein